jgi:GABA(A) receptor-associated protein
MFKKDPIKKIDIVDRLKVSEKILTKYPDCVPVIIRKRHGDKILQDIDREKYLIPKNLRIGEIMIIIRKHIQLEPKQAIFLFVGEGILVPTSTSIWEIYKEHRDQDNFLYMTYCSENTFG